MTNQASTISSEIYCYDSPWQTFDVFNCTANTSLNFQRSIVKAVMKGRSVLWHLDGKISCTLSETMTVIESYRLSNSKSAGPAFVLSACALQARYEELLPASCLHMNKICSTEKQSSCIYYCLYKFSVFSQIFQ